MRDKPAITIAYEMACKETVGIKIASEIVRRRRLLGGDVVQFTGITTVDLKPDDILEANKGQFKHVILIGPGNDGRLRYCGSTSNVPHVIAWLEMAKAEFIKMLENENVST